MAIRLKEQALNNPVAESIYVKLKKCKLSNGKLGTSPCTKPVSIITCYIVYNVQKFYIFTIIFKPCIKTNGIYYLYTHIHTLKNVFLNREGLKGGQENGEKNKNQDLSCKDTNYQ